MFDNKKKLGQYFTTDLILQEKVYGFIKNKLDVILEPSFGRGDLVKYIYIYITKPKNKIKRLDLICMK